LGKSIVRPPSACPSCGVELRARDNVPIFSWLALRGRCARCGAPISVRYLLVEITNAALWFGAAVRFGVNAEGAAAAVTGSILLALAVIDLEHRRLPNAIVVPSTVAAVLGSLIFAVATGSWRRLVASVACGAAAFLLFLLIALVSGGMGFGDVKLAAFVGVVTGWFDPTVTAAAVFFSFFAGGLAAVGMLATRRAQRKSAIPFGPAIAVGAMVALFVGADPVKAYLGF
jgi:leader peptidase (prepilin peptidase)/N-methyltransferase